MRGSTASRPVGRQTITIGSTDGAYRQSGWRFRREYRIAARRGRRYRQLLQRQQLRRHHLYGAHQLGNPGGMGRHHIGCDGQPRAGAHLQSNSQRLGFQRHGDAHLRPWNELCQSGANHYWRPMQREPGLGESDIGWSRCPGGGHHHYNGAFAAFSLAVPSIAFLPAAHTCIEFFGRLQETLPHLAHDDCGRADDLLRDLVWRRGRNRNYSTCRAAGNKWHLQRLGCYSLLKHSDDIHRGQADAERESVRKAAICCE